MLVGTRVLASVEPGACERSLVVVAEVGDRGTADTGLSRCLARNGVGEDRVKEGDRVRGGLVELNGGSVEGLGTAGTAPRRREEEGRERTHKTPFQAPTHFLKHATYFKEGRVRNRPF